LFGTVYYDPDGRINILDYASSCREFIVRGVKSDERQPEDYYEISFPALGGETMRFELNSDDIYVADFLDWYEKGFLTSRAASARPAIKDQTTLSARQQRTVDLIDSQGQRTREKVVP
jgi:hypothetical protein